MTLSQMGFFVGTEVIAHDRHNQMLDLIVASPASYFALIGTRVFVLTAISRKESRESRFWLRVALKLGKVTKTEVEWELNEAGELRAMIVAAIKTAQSSSNRGSNPSPPARPGPKPAITRRQTSRAG